MEASPNAVDADGRTALHVAILNGQDWFGLAQFGKPIGKHYSHQIISCLVKQNASVNLQDCFGETPLHIAAKVQTRGTLDDMDRMATTRAAWPFSMEQRALTF